jgi:hypothetical protein
MTSTGQIRLRVIINTSPGVKIVNIDLPQKNPCFEVQVDEKKELAERWRLELMEQKFNTLCINRTYESSHERCPY